MTETLSAPRRRRWVWLPLVIVLLLAALWTGGWFYAANRAETVIAGWIEREARDGRHYDCGSRQIGGYPFRFEVRCTDPTVTLPSGEGPVALKARHLVAVAQVYQPDLIIAEATGPMTVAIGGQPPMVADWSLLQASARGRPRDPQRISLVVDGLKLDRPSGTGSEPVARAQRVEAHARKQSNAPPDNPAFDLAGRAIELALPELPALRGRPVNVDATGVLRGLGDLAAKPLPQRLRDWQAAGGRLEITNVRVQQGDAVAVAKGDIGLTPNGRLDGTVQLLVAGLDQLLGAILGQGDSPGRGQAGLMTGLRMLGRAELEGKRALSVPVVFREGRVFFGPIPVGQTAPLY